jgi:hypothetical protein
MTRSIPSHISASQAIAAAETLFLAEALSHSHSKCRNREIKAANILATARQKTDVFLHEVVRRLSSGGADDYCI